MARAFIGTSGRAYETWRHDFYEGVPRARWLEHCASRFTALEINATFHRRQRRATLVRWAATVPDAFVLALKAHRYVPHSKLLLDPKGPVRRERDRAAVLGPRLGAVLWQVPQRLEADPARLARFAAGYSPTSLRRWADRIGRWLADGRDVHVYFDNDAEGAAPRDAMALLPLLERDREGTPAGADDAGPAGRTYNVGRADIAQW
jgi:uncharacterized protein YecE (DUF72 family)